jgi:hypothetical protein
MVASVVFVRARIVVRDNRSANHPIRLIIAQAEVLHPPMTLIQDGEACLSDYSQDGFFRLEADHRHT